MIWLFVGLALYWFAGYIAVRINAYEYIYHYGFRLTLGFWVARVIMMFLFGVFYLAGICLDAEPVNRRRGFFTSPHKHPNDHLRARMVLGNLFNIKEDR
jgi:hypothetical protein